MRVAVITGGVGGARFLRGLQALTHTPQWADLSITAIANIGDDITLHDLRICPDLDTVMYTLGGGVSEERGWGRDDDNTHSPNEKFEVKCFMNGTRSHAVMLGELGALAS